MTQPESRLFPEPLHVGRPNVGDREVFLRYVGDMFDRGWLSNDGPLVREFEQRLANHLGVDHVVAMCNGTIALEIAIRASGLTGEVIVPSYTFVATAHALSWQGITPVFADIDPQTHQLDPNAVRRMITPRTTGIIGVHLWGRSAPVEELQDIAEQNGLQLMFDAAHSFSVSRNGRMIGGFGRAEIFSFHATKFFNSFEGGAIATNDDELADTARLMRNFGFVGEDNVVHPGTNGKMTEVCAAMGLTNLESLDQIVEINRRNFRRYSDLLARIPDLHVLPYDETEVLNYQYVVIEVDSTCGRSRDHLIQRLRDAGVLARRYFWPGVHRMQPYRDLYPHAGLLLPHTETLADRVIVLPTGTAVSDQDIDAIARLLAAESA